MGNRIKMLREQRHMKQEELAAILGIRQNTLSTWETGRYQPDHDMLKKIAKEFNVSVDYLIGNDPPWSQYVGDQIDGLRMIRLVRTVEQLTPEQCDRVLDYAQMTMLGETANQAPIVSAADIELLQAFHDAPASVSTAIQMLLQPYKKSVGSSETA